MDANSGIYLGPLDFDEYTGLPVDDHEPILVGSGSFSVDRPRGEGHGIYMRKAHAGFCPMAKDGHTHWFVGMRKKCVACLYDPLELTDRQKVKAERAKTLTEATQQMQTAVGDFQVAIGNAGITIAQAGRGITELKRTRSHGPDGYIAKPNPAARNVIQR